MPTRKATIAGWGASVAVVIGLTVLAAPVFSAMPNVAGGEATPTPTTSTAKTPVSTPEPAVGVTVSSGTPAADAIGCDAFAVVGGYAGAPRPSDRHDHGAREFATGAVTYDENGNAATYTVAAGDAGDAIGERFCVDYVTLLVANDAWPTIHPGDVLVINP